MLVFVSFRSFRDGARHNGNQGCHADFGDRASPEALSPSITRTSYFFSVSVYIYILYIYRVFCFFLAASVYTSGSKHECEKSQI